MPIGMERFTTQTPKEFDSDAFLNSYRTCNKESMGRFIAHQRISFVLAITSALIESPKKPFSEWTSEDVEGFILMLEQDIIPQMILAIEVIYLYLTDEKLAKDYVEKVHSLMVLSLDILKNDLEHLNANKQADTVLDNCQQVSKLVSSFCMFLSNTHIEIIKLSLDHQAVVKLPHPVVSRIIEETLFFTQLRASFL